MCEFCTKANHGYGKTEVYYSDVLCIILDCGIDGLLGIYKYHQTPKPEHKEWIELQIKVIARKKWSMDWTMKYEGRWQHAYWTVRSKPNREMKKKWRKYLPQGRTKPIKEV